ncbi:hypothetical protein GWR56_14210 [Mucilaginibacter sp. 14171R-50]|uniref:hypothetical protein n=1 Tax=Mucilaginibacter sp. 14171R-50 TaxID=2703789 RepID=UPI00138D6437|nr:hypothetical protein [Mucilaginibacter sp. 14171R-50]QHS56640.1 hypothetical protein GWR56_14210 [Mucilaginibacter sp. 14171R-50]
MKTLTIPQPNISSLFKRNTDHTAVSQNPISSSTAHANQKHVMSAGEYIINVLGEGFKQNFLGADINMEFLTLTVRSYATSTAKALRKLVVKPAAKQHHINPTSI